MQEDAEHLEDMFDEYNGTNFDQLFIPLSDKELFTSELQLKPEETIEKNMQAC